MDCPDERVAIACGALSCVACRWATIAGNDKVPISDYNVLQYAVTAYFKTLLKNYTTQALGAHVLWTIRYLAATVGWDWGVLRRHFTATLHKKDITVAQCLQAVTDAGYHAPVYMVDTVRQLLQRWDVIAGAAAVHVEHRSSSAALHLRSWCLRLLTAAEARHPGGINVTIKKKRGDSLVEEVIVVHPKLFKLTPLCQRAAPFVTLDNLWAARVLGLQRQSLAPHGADDPVEWEWEGEPIPIPDPRTLVPFRPLELLFGQDKVVKRWLRHNQTTVPFPATIRTDGVQLHVPVVVRRVVPADVAAQSRPCKSKDPLALAAQLGRGDGHGDFAEVAVATLPGPGPFQAALDRIHDGLVVGVDPGLISPVAASNGVQVPSAQMYGGRKDPPRRTFDPGGGGGGGAGAGAGAGGGVGPRDFTRSGHSRRSRNNCVPRAVTTAEAALSAHPPGATLDHFVDYLTVYFQHEESQLKWYGSRTQRSVRFVRAGRTRAIYASIINRIAPDPRTIIVFGSYSGRGCMRARGDTHVTCLYRLSRSPIGYGSPIGSPL